jgi:hypothetical protein
MGRGGHGKNQWARHVDMRHLPCEYPGELHGTSVFSAALDGEGFRGPVEWDSVGGWKAKAGLVERCMVAMLIYTT